MSWIKENRNIYGQYISQRPIGLCHCYTHRGAMTKQLMKKHKCMAKQCPYFQKNEAHPFWIQKEQIKLQKKLRKAALAV